MITKCRPTKVQCSHSPGSLLSETQDKALDVGHCCNPKNNVNGALHILFDAFSQKCVAFQTHPQSWMSHWTNWTSSDVAAAIWATARHTCKGKSSGKLLFRNRHFVISGVLSPPPPPPHPHQNNCGSIVSIPARGGGVHCHTRKQSRAGRGLGQRRIRIEKLYGGPPPPRPTPPPSSPSKSPDKIFISAFGANVLHVPQGHVQGVSQLFTLNCMSP